MVRYFIIILICLFLPIFVCVGQEIDKIRGLSWISVDYIKQMENHLPCECANSENYGYYISIAPKNTENKTYKHDERIPEIIIKYIIQPDGAREYFIISEDSNKYVISDGYSNLELILENDTLLLFFNGNYKKFIKSNYSFEYYYFDKTYALYNIDLLNKSLTLRDYPPIQSILKADSLLLFCNGWENINIVCSQKRNKLWILEIKNGYLFIKKETTPQRDPIEKRKIKTIKKLKWDTIYGI